MYQFGQFQKMPPSACHSLYFIGVLHDIGKLYIPIPILTKKEKLTDQECKEIKKHPLYGKDVLQENGLAAYILEPVLYHHENHDGSGYYGKKGAEIPYEAMLTRIVDSYDTLLNGRVYKKHLPNTWVIEELNRCSGTLYEPELTQSFTKFLDIRYS